MGKWGRCAAAAALVLGLAAPARATPISIDLGFGNFGHLKQTDTAACSGIDGTQACGPTAAANSFYYLQKTYAPVYGDRLVGAGTYADLVSVANLLGEPVYMDCVCDGGTAIQNFIGGKERFLAEVAPGTTAVRHKTVFGVDGDLGLPDFGFLYAMLSGRWDVELLLSYHDATDYQNDTGGFYGGHYVTMTGLTLQDANDDAMFNAGETLQLDFVDPDTGAAGSANGLLDGFGFDTGYGAGATVTGATITAIVAERPIPEPASWVLAIVALAALGRRRASA